MAKYNWKNKLISVTYYHKSFWWYSKKRTRRYLLIDWQRSKMKKKSWNCMINIKFKNIFNLQSRITHHARNLRQTFHNISQLSARIGTRTLMIKIVISNMTKSYKSFSKKNWKMKDHTWNIIKGRHRSKI